MKPEVKYKLIEWLIQTEDDEILNQVQAILEREENPVIGTGANGVPITKKDLIKRAEKAEEDIKGGRGYTHEQAKARLQKKFGNGRL